MPREPLVTLAGLAAARLRSGRPPPAPPVAGAGWPPTGRDAYAYSGSGIDSAIEHPGAIVLFDARRAAPVRELTAGGADLYPSFAPHGKAVAFERRGAVWTVPTSGKAPHRLLRRARQPSWSR